MATIAFGAFALVIGEFMPVGMLPAMASSLRVSSGTAGFALTATALVAAFTGPIAMPVIGTRDRRTVLLGLTVLGLASNIVTALAANYALLLAARILLGVALGCFWSIAVAAARRVAPRPHRGVSMVLGAISVATVISVPASAYAATRVDWHLGYVAVCAVGACVLLAQFVWLPPIPAVRAVGARDLLALTRRGITPMVLVTILLATMAHFTAYSYVTPFLVSAAHLSPAVVAPLLLLYGLMGIGGNFAGAEFAARRQLPATALCVALVCGSVLALLARAQTFGVVITALAIWAMAWGATPVTTNVLLVPAAEHDDHPSEAAQAASSSLYQLAIGLGSFGGGVAVNVYGPVGAFVVSGALGITAVVLVANLVRFNLRRRVWDAAPLLALIRL